ncbi:MAG TPA: LuxR C-terminal-related transcriptional regulator [Gaiellaceae bacterium]|nr:LuxR C-terminal-related transcriptional regulator [Gaiellaceae bacterium]
MARGERGRSRVRERLTALADAGLDGDQAQHAAIDVLRPALGFERWCWPRTDPSSALSNGGTADFDLWNEVPRIATLEEHGDVTRKPRLVLGEQASASLHAETRGDLARSRRWRECLQPYGVGDELMAVCRDRHGCWGSVELMRDSDDVPFSEDDVRFLHDLAPLLAAVVRRSAFLQRRVDDEDRELPPATLIIDADFRLTSWTPAAHHWLAELPPAVYEIAARVLTPPDDATGLPATVRMLTGTGRWVTLEGAPLEGADRGGVAITIRASEPAEIFDLLCKAHDLTRRERQLVALILEGLATKQLAAALCISPHTVQDHLKSVFAKTGLHSRRELASHLTGR